MKPATDDLAAYVAGFIAAEGTFLVVGHGRIFACVVALGASDLDSVELIHDYFGIGYVRVHPRRKAHCDDEARWTVRRLVDLVRVVVPFMDAHLPPSHKRDQYLAWRGELLDYWHHHARPLRRYEQ